MKKGWVIGLAALLFVLCLGVSAMAGEGDGIVGKWKTGNGKAIVQIFEKSGKYYGNMVWLLEPTNPDGSEKLDKENPDTALQTRKLIGLTMVSGLEFKGDNLYENGLVYAPDTGKTYKAKATLKGDSLDLRGFIGISLIGRTDTWTRVP